MFESSRGYGCDRRMEVIPPADGEDGSPGADGGFPSPEAEEAPRSASFPSQAAGHDHDQSLYPPPEFPRLPPLLPILPFPPKTVSPNSQIPANPFHSLHFRASHSN